METGNKEINELITDLSNLITKHNIAKTPKEHIEVLDNAVNSIIYFTGGSNSKP